MATPKVQPHFIVSLGKSLAQITSEFSPFPGYGLLVEGLCSILECVENVSQNRWVLLTRSRMTTALTSTAPSARFAARQLAARAHCFLVALRDSEKDGALRNPRLARETAQM